MFVYVVYGSRSQEATVRVARAIASSAGWSNEYEARAAHEVLAEEIRTPSVIFLGCSAGGAELDRSIRSLLDRLSGRSFYGVEWAVFDSRPDPVPKVAGSGIRRLRRAIEQRGGQLLLPPESFYGGETNGGITQHELERARAWGSNAIAAAVRHFGDPTVRAGALSGTSARPSWQAWCGAPS